MAEKKGAGGKPQEFDTSTGLYGSGGTSRNSETAEKTTAAIQKYSDDPRRDIAEYGGLERKLRKMLSCLKRNMPKFVVRFARDMRIKFRLKDKSFMGKIIINFDTVGKVKE